MAEPRLIITGGGGLLGTALRPLLPDADFPSSAEFDVRDFEQMHAYAQRRGCNLILHAAAFTSPPIVDKDPIHAIDVNIVGTANVVRLCARLDAHLFYLSTDYVFKGDQGPYQEDDPLHPVNNYAWSKLGGECAARLWHKSLIIRTSFG